MINHVRTRLVNIAAADQTVGHNGAVFIDPTFKPVKWAPQVQALRNALFGLHPSQLTLNYRAAQYMELIHGDFIAARFSESLDPRITYADDTKWFNTKWGVNITPVVASNGTLTSFGEFRSPNPAAVSKFTYIVTAYEADDDAILKIESTQPVPFVKHYQIPLGGNYQVELPVHLSGHSSGVYLKLTYASEAAHWVTAHFVENDWADHWLETKSNAPSGKWMVDVDMPPEKTLNEVYDEIKANKLNNLGGIENMEPFKTLYAIAERGETMVRRLAGSALLVAYWSEQNKR